jgi:hypothetical protein
MTMRPQPIDIRPMLDALPIGRDAASVRLRIEAMERVMEGLVTIPGTQRKVGLDVLLDLVPVVGTTVAALIGSWLVWEARNVGLSKLQMARMFGNVGVDWALGMIPFVGAVPDFFFRSNTRNLRILRRHLDRHHPATVTILN